MTGGGGGGVVEECVSGMVTQLNDGLIWKEMEFGPKWGLIGFRLELFTTRRSTPHITRLTLNKSSCTCLRHQVLPPFCQRVMWVRRRCVEDSDSHLARRMLSPPGRLEIRNNSQDEKFIGVSYAGNYCSGN